MYNKPEVRVLQNQEVNSRPVEVTSSEAANLLAKYGYSNPQTSTHTHTNSDGGLTAEDLYAQFDRELEIQRQRDFERRIAPKAITFDSRNINYSTTDYRNLDDGFGIQVQIVSDMPIYNNNKRY